MLPRSSRLRANSDFQQVYKQGTPLANKHLVVYFKENGLGTNRLGFSISKRFGGAVARNKARRRLAELFRRYAALVENAYDIVIIARRAAADASYPELEKSLVALLRRAPGRKGAKR